MSSNSTNSTPVPPYLKLWPELPTIVSEWAALIPLIVHLASLKGDHNLVGELALTGKLTLSLLPKLGHLRGIARLLSGIPDFLDRASSKSDLSSVVWDVDWGSSFPCANGAARDFLTRYALRDIKHDVDIETGTMTTIKSSGASSTAHDTNTNSVELHTVRTESPATTSSYRRYQTLNIIEISKGIPPRVSLAKKMWRLVLHFIHLPVLVILAVFLAFFGAWGTAATALLCVTTQIAGKFVPLGRPPGYLRNNEKSEFACMLSAIHPNASTWYMYVGDRASIDWLLNKTMITIEVESPFLWAWGFRLAHYLQILFMTFAAGNKGWDGVCLVCLLVVNALFKQLWAFPAHWAALQWISDSDLAVKAHRFRLTGRIPMLGAVQMLNDSRKLQVDGFAHGSVSWMDEILHPSQRRQVWVEKLVRTSKQRSGSQSGPVINNHATLSSSEENWVADNLQWTEEAYDRIMRELQWAPTSFTRTIQP